MSDPKIRVGADMSAVNQELGKLEAAANKVASALSGGEVGIDVKKAKADLNDLNEIAASVAASLGKIGDASGPSDVDFKKIATALGNAADAGDALEKVLEAVGQSTNLDKSIRGSKAIADNLDRARRAQEILTRDGIKLTHAEARSAKEKFDHWRGSGARGTSKLRGTEFDDWVGGGWRNHSIDEGEASRNRRRILSSLGVSGGGGVHGENARSRWSGRGMGAVGGALGGVAGSLMQGGDGFFSSLGSAGGGLIGMAAGGLAAGAPGAIIGGLVGTAASKALGALGGALDASLQRVIADSANLTDLRHSIGSTTTDFETMRQNIRDFSTDLRLTNEEASRLARTFSDASGVAQNSQQVAGGMRLGAGFARSHGVDPSMGVAFIGTMRRMGQEGDTRLALKIGEVVARNGVTPQFGAILQAIQGFTESTTRTTFSKANAGGYADFMSSMFGGGLAGSKDAGAITSAMGAADSAMRQGGAFGEASKAFTLGMYQRKLPGFSVFDLNVMKEQGAFGTIGNAFGKDSTAYQFAKDRKDKGLMAKYSRWASGPGANETVLSMSMKSLEQFHGGNTEGFRTAIEGHFGVGSGQAAALYDAYKRPGGLGKLQKQLQEAGVDLGTFNPNQIGDLAQISGMDKGQLKAQAAKLLGDSSISISADDRKKLEEGSLEEQRKVVLRLTALNQTEKDAGETLEQQHKTIMRLTDDLTTRLTPAVMELKQVAINILSAIAPGNASTNFGDVKSAGALNLDANQKKVRDMIIRKGSQLNWSSDKINSVLGLVQSESTMNPNANVIATLSDGSKRRQYGLGQWDPGWMKKLGMRYGSLEDQINKGIPELGRQYDEVGGNGRIFAERHHAGLASWKKDASGNWKRVGGGVDSLGTSSSSYWDTRVGPNAKAYAEDKNLLHNQVAGSQAPTLMPRDPNDPTNPLRDGADAGLGAGLNGIFPGLGYVMPSIFGNHTQKVDVGITLKDTNGKPIPHHGVQTNVGPPAPAGGGGW